MNPTDRLLAADRDDLLLSYRAMLDDPEGVQAEVLADIVGRARDTEWGREHGFASVESVADFRSAQPLTDWSTMAPYGDRMQAGERDLTFPGAPSMFVLTSGTTGSVKHIPEAAAGELAKKATQDTRIVAVLPHFPELAESGAILTFANRRVFGYTECGIPFGSASGANVALAPPLGLERLAYPLWVPDVADSEQEVDYLILRFALERDVRVVRGNNAGRLVALLRSGDAMRDRLIDDIRVGRVDAGVDIDPALLDAEGLAPNPVRADELAAAVAERGRLDAVSAWPGLGALLFWLSGSVGRFVNDLDGLVPAGAIRWDLGYGSSEGRFNVPLEQGVSAGPLALHAHLYEFLPLDGGDPLLAHEVVDGESYELVVTSYSGLYRYAMHDIVRVEGFTGRTPNIVFVSKAGDIGNIAGEKVPGPLILAAITRALGEAGVEAQHVCVVTNLDLHRYEVCLELRPGVGATAPEVRPGAGAMALGARPGSPRPPADLIARVDAALGDEAIAYRLFREQGLIADPVLHLMAPGWQERLYQDQVGPGRGRSQVKLPVVHSSIPAPEMVLTPESDHGLTH